jgi:rhodanese-related sulfurtransferase
MTRIDADAQGLLRFASMSNEERSYRSVGSEEAERLVRDPSVRVLDVRTPEEYRDLGHIPGAMLLPVDLVASALATLPRDGRPLLIYCEHGIRSAAAARLLARGGFSALLNLKGGMSTWHGPREFSPGQVFGPLAPASWLVLNADLLPTGGRVLDVACGSGRNALLLAMAGFPVRAVDRDPNRIESLQDIAGRLGLGLDADVLDLEAEDVSLGSGIYSVVLGIHYLHRPLFPALIRSLAPGGILLYETFTEEQAQRGKPTCPDFLLKPGELRQLVKPLEVIREREGEFEGRMISAVAARHR